jgi:hypothetical protein
MIRATMIGVVASAALSGVANAQGRGGGGGGGGGGARKDDATPPGTVAPAADAGTGGVHRHAKAGFDVWLPPAWSVKEAGERFTAQNPRDTVEAVVGPLADHDADLTDEDVIDFIDDELDDLKVTSDTPTKLGGVNARLIEGTASDEGDVVIFRAAAIDASDASAVLMALVYGDEEPMTQPNVQTAIKRIFSSLKPA